MSSVRALFARRAGESGEGISTAAAYAAFVADVEAYGLGSDAFRTTLATLWTSAAAHGRTVRYGDLLDAASSFSPDGETAQVVQDLRGDASALARFAQFVRERYTRSGPQRQTLGGSLEDVADSYRTALRYVLRTAAREASAIDGLSAAALITGPINAALRAEAGPAACMEGSAWSPSPWEWQRVHSYAINVRLARSHVKAATLTRVARLYRVDRGPEGGGAGSAPPESAPVRLSCPDVFLAHRGGSNPEDCAQAAVPYELEVVRMPVLGSTDAVAASSLTHAGWHGARAIVPALHTPPAGRGMCGVARASGPGSFTPSPPIAIGSFAMEEGEFASFWAMGGAPVPAPSALPGVPRAHASTLAQAYAEYQAASELILSPYAPDVCGVHEAEEGARIAGSLGCAVLFVTEFTPCLVPLAQLRSSCGALTEGRPFFRHLAAELARALADVEAQCSLSLPPGGITAENVYVSESGTRLLLRGVTWGDPIPPGRDGTEALLARRSRALMQALGDILGSLLLDEEEGPSPGLAGVATGPSGSVAAYSCSAALQGIAAVTGEEFDIVLADPPGCTWCAPLLALPGLAPGVGADAEGADALAMRLSPGRATGATGEGDGAGGMPLRCISQAGEADGGGTRTRFMFVGTAPGAAALHLCAVRKGAAPPPSALPPSLSLQRAESLLQGAGFGTLLPPAPTSEVVVPLTVYGRAASPTLCALLATCAPAPDESAGMAVVKLIAGMHGKARGGGGGGDPHDDSASFLATARVLAAVLGLTASAGMGLEAGGMTARQVSALAYGAVSDSDGLAALIAVMEEAEGGSGEVFGPHGNAVAEAMGDEVSGSGRVRWLSHLARHPYFATPQDVGAVSADYAAYARPLAEAQAHAAGGRT